MNRQSDRVIRLGRITGAHGVKGWVRVESFTEPKTNLLHYESWLLEHLQTPVPIITRVVRDAQLVED